MSSRPSGFTLIEVLIAVIVTALAALLAHGIFGAALDGAREIRQARATLDRQMNAARLLSSVFLSLDVGLAAGTFDGRPDRIEFTSSVLTADGWREPARVRLGAESGSLIYRAGASEVIALADSVTGVRFDYLLQPGAEARWVGSWTSPVSAPLAVRMRVTRVTASGAEASDTSLFLIEARG
jgi:prepilin-type N-terminal cleavage/methylation domain-containing protein